jgi:acyl-CoA thioester hydrolase
MSFEPWKEAGYRCVIYLPVQWGDQDAMGHVNNTIPLRWFESARIAYLEQSQAAQRLREHNLGPILASLRCDYRRQVRYPDTVAVGAKVVSLGNASFQMQHAAWSLSQQALVTEGTSVLVVFDYNNHRPQRMPDAVRQVLAAFEGWDGPQE